MANTPPPTIDYYTPRDELAHARYVGFWWRALAFLIDYLIILFVTTLVNLMLRQIALDLAILNANHGWPIMLVPNTMGWLAMWLYFALMESSRWQASLGKILVGIRVTDTEGRRINFARATLRAFVKWPTVGFAFLSFMGDPPRMQAFHDKMAGTLVVRERPWEAT